MDRKWCARLQRGLQRTPTSGPSMMQGRQLRPTCSRISVVVGFQRPSSLVKLRAQVPLQSRPPFGASGNTLRSTKRKAATLEQPSLHQDQQISQQAEAGEGTFSWTKQWYPLAAVEDLDPARPHSVMLLGKKLVLWRDNEEKWRCFEDVCPHRKVPLSEGRIETSGPMQGLLQCGYHGWILDGTGRTVYIPQLASSDKKAEEVACSSARACATSFPTEVSQGLIYVWAESGKGALGESAAKKLPINALREKMEDDFKYNFKNYVRDLPGGFEVWLENSSDQSHVFVSHHGIAGSRGGEKEGYFKWRGMKSNPSASAEDGFAYTFDFTTNGERVSTGTMTFEPPCKITFQIGQMPNSALWIYLVPTGPNNTRIIINNGGEYNFDSKLTKFLKKLPYTQDLLRALPHLVLNAVQDGDAVFMEQQHANTREPVVNGQAGKFVRHSYYLPGDNDKGLIVWLIWLMKKAKGGPEYAASPPTDPLVDGSGKVRRLVLLDRLNQHTRICKSCSKTLGQIQLAQKVAMAALGVLFFSAAAILGRGLAPWSVPMLVTAVLAAGSTWLLTKLQRFEKSFVFTDWHQADLK